MIRRFSVLLMALLCARGSATAGPILVTPSNDATVLTNALLAATSGIAVNSSTYTGGTAASGTFTGGTGILAFDSGVVLTSGDASTLVGPNSDSGAGTELGLSGDPDLDALTSPYDTFDAASLVIEFVPTGSQVTFAYQFGSEEYNDYVNSEFNDVFAFFVNGVNYALLPGTSTAVAINNVNCYTNSGSYIPNRDEDDYNGQPGCGDAGLDTELDGLTTLLTFVAPVNPNVANTLKIAIADTSDEVLDSAVMIRAGSLQVCGEPGQPPCATAAPEPATLLLVGTGLLGAGLLGRRRR